jgi:hypothetical protein
MPLNGKRDVSVIPQWNDKQLSNSKYASLVPVADPEQQPPPPPDEAPQPPTVSQEASTSAVVLPKGWEDMKMDEKILLVEGMTRVDILDLIRTHKKSHWKVRNAAKARIEILS